MADPFGDQDQSPGGASKRPAPDHRGHRDRNRGRAGERGRGTRRAAARGERRRRRPATRPSAGGEVAPLPLERPARAQELRHASCRGLLGGLVGVVASPLPGAAFGVGESDDATGHRRARSSGSPSSSPPSHRPETPKLLAQLKAQVEALETSTKDTAPKLADLADRVGQLETSLKAISQSASEGGSVASAAAITPADRRGRAAARQEDRRRRLPKARPATPPR